jgi:hypothetical protein
MVKLLQAGAVYVAVVLAAGFVFGSIRVPFVVPRLGVRVAELIEAPLMLVVILIASRFVVRRFDLAPQSAMKVGLLALALLVALELLLARVLSGLTVREYVLSRDSISGSVYVGLLMIFAVLPWLRARRLMEVVHEA